jgi:hypothetical protein
MSSSVSFDLPASMQSITSEDPLTSGKRVGPSKPSEMNNADFRQEDKQQREKKNLEAIWRIKSLYWIKLILTTQLHCWPIEGISGHSVVQTDQARIGQDRRRRLPGRGRRNRFRVFRQLRAIMRSNFKSAAVPAANAMISAPAATPSRTPLYAGNCRCLSFTTAS